MKKRLLKVKYENIALILLIPLAIIQFLKANADYKVSSLLISLMIYGGTYLTIYTTRKEALLSVKDEIEKPIIKTLLTGIKKEIIKQARNINDQAYILRASFK